MHSRGTRSLAGALAALVLAVSAIALASAGGGDEGAESQAIVDVVSGDQAHKAVTAETLQRARDALERGKRMRAAGDEAHARLAEGLALEWAVMAKDLVAAADAEKKAGDARRDALDAGAALERERAMLEESITRAGRLRAELEAAEQEAKATNRTAAVDAGAKTRRPRPTQGGAP
jgi:hypothetical protein